MAEKRLSIANRLSSLLQADYQVRGVFSDFRSHKAESKRLLAISELAPELKSIELAPLIEDLFDSPVIGAKPTRFDPILMHRLARMADKSPRVDGVAPLIVNQDKIELPITEANSSKVTMHFKDGVINKIISEVSSVDGQPSKMRDESLFTVDSLGTLVGIIHDTYAEDVNVMQTIIVFDPELDTIKYEWSRGTLEGSSDSGKLVLTALKLTPESLQLLSTSRKLNFTYVRDPRIANINESIVSASPLHTDLESAVSASPELPPELSRIFQPKIGTMIDPIDYNFVVREIEALKHPQYTATIRDQHELRVKLDNDDYTFIGGYLTEGHILDGASKKYFQIMRHGKIPYQIEYTTAYAGTRSRVLSQLGKNQGGDAVIMIGIERSINSVPSRRVEVAFLLNELLTNEDKYSSINSGNADAINELYREITESGNAIKYKDCVAVK